MKKALLLLFTSCIAKTLLAGAPFYPITDIPEELKKHAHSVVRLSETTNRIVSAKEIRTTEHVVITILDAEGEKHANLVRPYSKMYEIRSISGTRYNLLGLPEQKLKQSEIKDYGGMDDEALISDTRYKLFSFNSSPIYPYTVEYEVEYKYNSALYAGSWYAQDYSLQAVQKSVVNVIVPQGMQIHYKALNFSQEPVVADVKEGKSYTWTLSDLPALRNETYGLPVHERTKGVMIAVNDFEYGDFRGSGFSWQELGNFFYRLNANRDVLPPNTKAKVHELTDGLSSPEEKVKVLYRYLQQNFRYIGIQLGIGGYQTIDAATTAKTGYGDCKSLSNMMYSLLKEAGVPSNKVLVYASESPLRMPVDFASNRFNHVVLCVPDGKDSIWLECTSHTTAAGYMGTSTCNRPVLMLDSTNSKLVYTPSHTKGDNQRISVLEATVNDTGHIFIHATIRHTGQEQESVAGIALNTSKTTQLERLRESLNLATYDVLSYDVNVENSKQPAATEKLQVKASHYASVTGKRMFLLPNILHATGIKMEPDSLRASQIRFDEAYTTIDTCYIKIPAGYQLEGLPKPQQLKTKFGTFDMSIVINDKTITYIRKLEMEADTYPAADYPDLVAFRNAVYKSDHTRIVFVKE